MTNLCGDIDIELSDLERIEIFWKGAPVPGKTLGKHDSRDVLNTFHEAHHDVAMFLFAGSESHATVPHDDGRDT